MSKTYNIDVSEYVNKLSNNEFKRILDTPGGDRDHIIFNVDLNSLDPAKLIILVRHEAYALKNQSYENKVIESCLSDNTDRKKQLEEELNCFRVVKRDGRTERLDQEKIFERIRKLWKHPPVLTNITEEDLHTFTDAVIKGIYNGISTSELDEQAAIIAAHMTVKHPDYGTLA
jgi:hypothetical protein